MMILQVLAAINGHEWPNQNNMCLRSARTRICCLCIAAILCVSVHKAAALPHSEAFGRLWTLQFSMRLYNRRALCTMSHDRKNVNVIIVAAC
eukprot:4450261-Amphidinium_carterae.1